MQASITPHTRNYSEPTRYQRKRLIVRTIEYSDAKVHPFRKFRAPFSRKAEHTFPE